MGEAKRTDEGFDLTIVGTWDHGRDCHLRPSLVFIP